LVLAFVNEPAAVKYERQNRDTGAAVGFGHAALLRRDTAVALI
jgi:hypothetical protein